MPTRTAQIFALEKFHCPLVKGLFFSRGRSDQLFVGDPLPGHAAEHFYEAVTILTLAGIVTEDLLVDVGHKVLRVHANVGAGQRALQERPEVFQTVSVDVTAHVLNRMVNRFVDIRFIQAAISGKRIGANSGFHFNVLKDCTLKAAHISGRDNHCADLERPATVAPLKDAHDNGFSCCATALNPSLALARVHIGSRTADKRFIGLYGAVQFLKRASLNRNADAMQNEPCAFLSNADGAVNLVAANAVFGVQDKPDGREPLAHRDRAVLKDCADLNAELVVPGAILTNPKAARLDLPEILALAARALDAIRPAHLSHKLIRAVGVGKLLNALNQGLRKLCHADSFA